MKKLLLLALLPLLTGCAGYKSDYDQYAAAYAEHNRAVTATVEAMAIVASDSLKSIKDPTAQALFAVMTQQQIQAVSASRFDLARPTTWTDFWSGLWPTVTSAVPYIGIGYVANQGFKAAGHNNYLNADQMDINKSFNASEVHMTGSSQGTITAPFMQETNHTYTAPVTITE